MQSQFFVKKTEFYLYNFMQIGIIFICLFYAVQFGTIFLATRSSKESCSAFLSNGKLTWPSLLLLKFQALPAHFQTATGTGNVAVT